MKKSFFLTIAAAVCMASACTGDFAVPNEVQKEWADAEIGVMFHFDMQVFNPDYEFRHWGTHPDASTFNPTELDTDQWLEAASKIGAKYAVLVAKHCCGFSLWPTEAHEYSIKNSPWKNGEGDIVRDFVESCKKYNVKPAIYASTSANGYYWVDNPGVVQPGSPFTQEEYRAMVEKQLTELWTNYGDLFEIWFDGGVLSMSKGGADVLGLVRKLQPNAIAFQGPYGHPNLIRWVGNEVGTAPYPCWATADATTDADGTKEISGLSGNPDGKFWCPGEADCTLRHNDTRQGGWMWAEGEDDRLYTVDELMTKYETSVGRNTNLLLGLVVDKRGLVPEGDVARLEEFGEALKAKYGTPCATTSGNGRKLELTFPQPTTVDRVVLREDISLGERVLAYELQGKNASGNWESILKGISIGHKRIDLFRPTELSAIRLIINEDRGKPHIAEFSAFPTEPRSRQVKLFEDGNYAMFIHFGLYSKMEGTWKDKPYWGNAEWIMNENQAGIPVKEYMAEAADFKPSEFDAEAVAQLAKDAGMKYIVITSKHHEGFAMFDSDADDFNICDAGGFGRDIMGELAEACHRNGLGIGFYYSQFQDWTTPGGGNGPSTDASGRKIGFDEYFRTKCVPQVRELLTKYGEIELIWFDTPGDMDARYSKELVDLVHELQPGTLVSSRVGNDMGDYESLGDMEVPLKNIPGLWEGIDVTQVGWGFNRNDSEWKTPDFIVRHLTSVIARGGTFMLNVGPTSTGAIAPEVAGSLRRAGEWVHKYPDAVYNAGASPWGHALPWGDAVTQPNRIYLIVYDWPKDGKLRVPGIRSGINGIKLYGGRELTYTKESGMTCIDVPFIQPDEFASVIEIDIAGCDIDRMITLDPSIPTELSVAFGEHDGCHSTQDSWMEKFGEWKFKNSLRNLTQNCWFDWTVNIPKAGYYDIELEYKGGDFVLWQVEVDGKPVLINHQKATNSYDWHRLGWIKIENPDRHCICVRPVDGDFANAKPSSIRFTPVNI